MTGKFQEELRHALQTLFVRIFDAVHAEVSASLQETFHRAARDASLGFEVRPRSLEPGSVPRTTHRARRAETRARIVQSVREAPGTSADELAQSLGLRRDVLRRHLLALAFNDTLRVEPREDGAGELQQRLYCVQDTIGSDGTVALVAGQAPT